MTEDAGCSEPAAGRWRRLSRSTSSGRRSPQAAPPKTIEPGKLTVGINGDMPMTSVKDGKLIGTDGELLAAIAGKLGLEVKPQQMEWSALIQATKQGKVDIMLGSMGWTKERTQVMLLTDPIYYFGTFLLQKKSTSYSTFEDMKGHSGRHGDRLHAGAGAEVGAGHRRGQALRHLRRRDARRARRPARHGGARSGPGAVRAAPAPGMGAAPGGAEAASPTSSRSCRPSTTRSWASTRRRRSSHDAINGEIAKAWADCDNVKTMAPTAWATRTGSCRRRRTTASASTGRRAGRRRPRRAGCFKKS